MTKITLDQLMRKLADPATTEADLRPYFTLTDGSGPFAPMLAFDPARVAVPDDDAPGIRSALALDWLNGWCRARRRGRFEERMAGGYRGPVIVAEGDSWFQYPLLLRDTIDVLLDDYAILSLDAAGDTLSNMIGSGEYLTALKATNAQILLFSGGGNDLLAGGNLAEHLHAFEEGLTAAQYLLPSFQRVLGDALGHYDRLFRQIEKDFPTVTLIGHGYDRVIPDAGRWLGKPMAARGIVDRALQRQIADLMIDRFNDGLHQLARSYPRVRLLDNRGTLRDGDWYDELHPTDPGFERIASRFKTAIGQVSAALPKDAPPLTPMAVATPKARSGKRKPARPLAAPAVISRRNAYALHIGLNAVDAGHYNGWVGKLRGCEYDADDMAELARQQGFDTAKLLTAAATVPAVTAKIRDAAASLRSGDMFFLSYSGHGGTVPDYNGDEDDQQDETWCLFDRQLIDDELYFLWREFQPGVRVLVVADSCHSGTSVKSALTPAAERLALSVWPDAAIRLMPDEFAGRIFRNNKALYEDIQKSLPAIEPQFGRPVTHPVGATVRLISGCQDNQLSSDLPTNGAFTYALLRVWDNGRFEGTYETFTARIRQLLPATQVPNHWVVGQRDPVYDRQKPFTI